MDWNIFHHFSDVNALVDTIIECTEKIILHTQVFCKDLLSKGEVKKLMIVLSSIKLVKNKVVFFKSLFGKKIPKDYMDGDLEELIQSIYTQVIEYYKRWVLFVCHKNKWCNLMYKLVTYLLFYFILFLEWWNETIFIGIKTFVWSIRASEKQYFDSQNKKEIKWNKRQQITDLISDVNLTFVLVPFGGFRGLNRKQHC